MAEKDIEVEVEELTQRLKVMEEEMLGRTASTSTTKQAVNSRAKPDVYKDGPWEEWVTHFQLCAEINQWDEEQCCQQLAVSLRGRAQTVYVTLGTEEKSSYNTLLAALNKKMTPPQERVVHKLAFRQRKREKGETLVDLATNLRRLSARAYPGKDPLFIEDEIVDQFISALDSRELRIGVSQTSPLSLDEALSTALRLESLHAIESKHRDARINMADIVDNEMTTAGVNTVGARYDDTIPGWAKHYFEQQTKLMERLLEATTAPKAPRSRAITCFKCGKQGHYQRECRSKEYHDKTNQSERVQGNANRAGSFRT